MKLRILSKDKREWYDKLIPEQVQNHANSPLGLETIAINASNQQVALKAVELSTDRYALKNIVLRSKDRLVRISAWQKDEIKNDEFIMYGIVMDSTDRETALLSTGKIKDSQRLENLAIGARDSEVRFSAFQLLNIRPEKEKHLMMVAALSKDDFISVLAVQSLSAQESFQYVVNFGKNFAAREKAVRYIEDKKWLKWTGESLSGGSKEDKRIAGMIALKFMKLS